MEFRIKEIRERKGMSQEELSGKSGVSRTTISGLESGSVVNATVVTISKIAEVLDVQVADIFFSKDV